MQNNGMYTTEFTWNSWQGMVWKHLLIINLVPTEPDEKAQKGK